MIREIMRELLQIQNFYIIPLHMSNVFVVVQDGISNFFQIF